MELGGLILLPFLPVIKEALKVSDQFKFVRDIVGNKTIASDSFNLFSQRREQEADYIGMLLMSEAGFNPSAAVSILEDGIREKIIYRKADPGSADEALPVGRILVINTGQDKTRIERSQKWIPEVLELTGRKAFHEDADNRRPMAMKLKQQRWEEFRTNRHQASHK
ncbi:MAG: hypothetical protein Q9192_007187 [Flavoplaca navasiana]